MMAAAKKPKKPKTWPMSEIAKVVVRGAVNTKAAADKQFAHDIQLARDHDKVPKNAGTEDGETWIEQG